VHLKGQTGKARFETNHQGNLLQAQRIGLVAFNCIGNIA